MGADISIIVRCDFHDVRDRNAARKYAREVHDRLNAAMHLEDYGAPEGFIDDGADIGFRLPVYEADFYLRNGYWQIEPYLHYCQIMMHDDGYFWVRSMTFDIARALGEKEAWYAEEYYTWNGGPSGDPGCDLEGWLAFARSKYGRSIPEYDQKAIVAAGNDWPSLEEPVFHDGLSECRELFDNVQASLPDHSLLGLYRFGACFRCERNGLQWLVDAQTLLPMYGGYVSKILDGSFGSAFIISRDGEYAVFSGDGAQLTDFVCEKFTWRWTDSSRTERELVNDEAGIHLII